MFVVIKMERSEIVTSPPKATYGLAIILVMIMLVCVIVPNNIVSRCVYRAASFVLSKIWTFLSYIASKVYSKGVEIIEDIKAKCNEETKPQSPQSQQQNQYEIQQQNQHEIQQRNQQEHQIQQRQKQQYQIQKQQQRQTQQHQTQQEQEQINQIQQQQRFPLVWYPFESDIDRASSNNDTPVTIRYTPDGMRVVTPVNQPTPKFPSYYWPPAQTFMISESDKRGCSPLIV